MLCLGSPDNPEHSPSPHCLLISTKTIGVGCSCFVLFCLEDSWRWGGGPSYDVVVDAPACVNTTISLSVTFLNVNGQSRNSVLNYKNIKKKQIETKGRGERDWRKQKS